MLFGSLIDYLHDYGIFVLQQIHNFDLCLSSRAYWLSTKDLDLGGGWKFEWDTYISSLDFLGVHFSPDVDQIVWSFNIASGQNTTKLAYDFIVEKLLILVGGW